MIQLLAKGWIILFIYTVTLFLCQMLIKVTSKKGQRVTNNKVQNGQSDKHWNDVVGILTINNLSMVHQFWSDNNCCQ